MNDITILFLTANELPIEWAEYQKDVLLTAVCGAPIITLSMKPLDWGQNVLQDRPRSLSNIYWQMLRGARLATTEFIGIAEDDTLYHKEHFSVRPASDEFAYNMCHWALFTWGTPTYHWRNRHGNYSMIAPRELMIDALEERFEKYPDGTPDDRTGELGRGRVQRALGVKERKLKEFWTTISVVNFQHKFSQEDYQKRQVKRMGSMRAFDIPYWGHASELVKNFK
jgi:hypothetical protein